ncbi:hypothetical protein A2369_00320 [candidate division WS6 bacterium RIFOXYB1_FULL_33_15]|nr:MAG: hypothetical protein A2369_00320 [candidate division WS6 bacterium RIFOXYB1_FULL_33_15]
MNSQLKLILYILLVVSIFYFIQNKFSIFDIKLSDDVNKEQNEEEVINKDNTVEIFNSDGKTIIVNVELADTVLARSNGLSGRKELGEYNGMLFIMDEEDISPFWMKDMYITLDMIFIDSRGYVVDIKENLSICESDYCPNILSEKPFKYVLEVNGNFCLSNRVGVGNTVIFNISSEE